MPCSVVTDSPQNHQQAGLAAAGGFLKDSVSKAIAGMAPMRDSRQANHTAGDKGKRELLVIVLMVSEYHELENTIAVANDVDQFMINFMEDSDCSWRNKNPVEVLVSACRVGEGEHRAHAVLRGTDILPVRAA